MIKSDKGSLLYNFKLHVMVLEDQWTADTWADRWKTCKTKKVDQSWHRFGANQRAFDAFVSEDSEKNL